MSPKFPHGGNTLSLSQKYNIPIEEIIDFSVNVRPEGVPSFIQTALWHTVTACDAYPSPHGEEAVKALKNFYGNFEGEIILGNGANELIHQIAQLSKIQTAYIISPAFASYERACRQAGKDIIHFTCTESNNWLIDKNLLIEELSQAPPHSAVFLANPSNPLGVLHDKDFLKQIIASFPHILWIIDEAFIDYVESDQTLLSKVGQYDNLIVLRSMTKFYGIAGIRLGFVVLSQNLHEQIIDKQYFWNINSFAITTALAICKQPTDFHHQEVKNNIQRRDHLFKLLQTIPGNKVIPSHANYICFRLNNTPCDLSIRLLREHHIALRDCNNYDGLKGQNWFRVAVRTEEDHVRLIHGLKSIINSEKAPSILTKKKKPALMLQGTCSDAGKSILTTAFCRIMLQDGYSVAPFKAQNMALNSGVTADGLEMGRAQIVQAKACLLDPDVRMNPILLKPHSQTGAQLVVMGKARQNMEAKQYFRRKIELWETVKNAYDSLSEEHDCIVLEGAGSPGEVNLKSADVVNMNMARHAQAKVLLAGDIDRGGVYASFLGTWMTFDQSERNLMAGFLINKFRGDADLLAPANQYIQDHTGLPIWGVIPMIRHLNIPEEDRAVVDFYQEKEGECLDVVAIMPNHVSNFTDLAPLAAEPDVRLRMVRSAEEWGNPDVVIIPGSKNVVHDFMILKEAGITQLIRNHAQSGKFVLGICGGLQMLGSSISDPHHIESDKDTVPMLGLLDLTTTFLPEKTLIQVQEAKTPLDSTSSGYEIHHGVSTHEGDCQPAFFREDGSICGYRQNNVWATYLHGCLDADIFRRDWIDFMKQKAGLVPLGKIMTPYNLDEAIDKLADVVRSKVDMAQLYKVLGLK